MRFSRTIAIGVVLGGAATASARGTCVVETKKAPSILVEVAPKEASPFKLRVEGVPLAIEPGGLETPATVRIKGALAFEGHMANAEIPARTRRAVDDLSGMVHLAPARERVTLHANVRSKLVYAVVKLTGIELRDLVLPCDAFTLDDVAEPKLSIEDDASPRLVAKGTMLHFRSAPGGKGAAVDVAVEDPGALELKPVEEQAGWVRVTNRWPDGTTLHGWVKRDELTEAGAHHERVGELAPTETPPPACAPPRTAPNERIATAPVAAGTQVYAARYLGPWAKVVDGSKLEVRFRPKDDWVEIVSVPGIACAINDAWIPRSAAKLPAEAPVTEAPASK